MTNSNRTSVQGGECKRHKTGREPRREVEGGLWSAGQTSPPESDLIKEEKRRVVSQRHVFLDAAMKERQLWDQPKVVMRM